MKSKLNKRPELVAPSGNWSGLSSACRAGADAVYFATRPQCLSTIQRDGGFDKLLRGPGGTPTNVKEIHTIVMDV